MFATADGSDPLKINRLSSDGPLAEFRKDGSSIGTIGTTAGRLYIGDGDVALRFADDLDFIAPWSASTNAARTGAISLGNSGNKFKDLHLSGSITSGAISSTGAVTGTSFTTTGTRVVNVANSTLTMKGDTGGWAFGLHALGSSNTNHGGFGFLGGADALSYYYIGESYNHATNFRFYKSGILRHGTTTIIDASRNFF